MFKNASMIVPPSFASLLSIIYGCEAMFCCPVGRGEPPRMHIVSKHLNVTATEEHLRSFREKIFSSHNWKDRLENAI